MNKTKFQEVIALSSTEAEIITVCEAGKNSLCISSILHDIGIEQHKATILYEGSQVTIAMENSGKLTTRTKHIDTVHFILHLWIERNLL